MDIKTLFLLVMMACDNSRPSTDDGLNANPFKTEESEGRVELEIGIEAVDGCSQRLGDRVCNMALRDQNDEYWELYDLEGKVILLDFSAMWCAPCQAAAVTVQDFQNLYEEQGFSYVTILIDDPYGEQVGIEDLQEWADIYEITTASILMGYRELIDTQDALVGYPIASWPTFVFIDRDLTVYYGIYGYNEDWLHSVVQEIL